jgi:hypothetical protein
VRIDYSTNKKCNKKEYDFGDDDDDDQYSETIYDDEAETLKIVSIISY